MNNPRISVRTRLAQLLMLIGFAANSQTKGDTFLLFYLGGQSNMEGFGYNKDLPAELQKEVKDVFIFEGQTAPDNNSAAGAGKWEALKPGHGTGFSSDGKTNKLSERFGPELTFGLQMKKLFPDARIAIVKYSRGGTAIDSLGAGGAGSWDPFFSGSNQYDHFLTTLSKATTAADVNLDGKPDTLIPMGIVWMQGESDAAFTKEIADRYYVNLRREIALFRAALRDNDLPVIIGKISDSGQNPEKKIWKFGEIIQAAQEKFVSTDRNARIVRTTEKYGYSDPYHYDSAGYIDLGRQFADALFSITQQSRK